MRLAETKQSAWNTQKDRACAERRCPGGVTEARGSSHTAERCPDDISLTPVTMSFVLRTGGGTWAQQAFVCRGWSKSETGHTGRGQPATSGLLGSRGC